MATVSDLMGLGMPPALSGHLGNTPATVAGVGTSQTGAAAITTHVTIATTAASQTAFVLPSTSSLGAPYYFFNTSSTAALVFPPSGGTIQGGSANASFSVAQNKLTVFMLLANNGTTTQQWAAVLSS